MPQVRVTREDIPLIQEIFDALAKALEELPDHLTGGGKFAVLAMTAVINLACRIALKSGVPREEFLRSVAKIWEEKAIPSQPRVWN